MPKTYRIMFSYSLSLPLESFHRRNITEASTLAGLQVLGSLSKLTTESRMVLKKENQKYYQIYTFYIIITFFTTFSCSHTQSLYRLTFLFIIIIDIICGMKHFLKACYFVSKIVLTYRKKIKSLHVSFQNFFEFEF